RDERGDARADRVVVDDVRTRAERVGGRQPAVDDRVEVLRPDGRDRPQTHPPVAILMIGDVVRAAVDRHVVTAIREPRPELSDVGRWTPRAAGGPPGGQLRAGGSRATPPPGGGPPPPPGDRRSRGVGGGPRGCPARS